MNELNLFQFFHSPRNVSDKFMCKGNHIFNVTLCINTYKKCGFMNEPWMKDSNESACIYVFVTR